MALAWYPHDTDGEKVLMTIIGAKVLLDMQNGDPRKLIRGRRAPMFFPWRPIQRAATDCGVLIVSSSSDLTNWTNVDRQMLDRTHALVRLARPGSITEPELMTMKGVETVWFDVWCGDQNVQDQLFAAMLEHLPCINNFVM